MSRVSRAIFNLKQSVQAGLSKTVFKNHRRQKLYIRPINEKAYYVENDIVKFDLKGHGVDYINLQNSFIMCEITGIKDSNYNSPTKQTIYLPYGTVGLLRRFRLLFGSVSLQDLENCGLLWWMLMYGSSVQENQNLGTGFTTTCDFKIDGTKNNPATMKIPFMTILDICKEIPIFQVADRVTMEFTLNSANNCICCEKEDTQGAKFMITKMRLVVDGRVATSGGILEGSEFTFHSWDWRGYQNFLNQEQKSFSISYDLKKSSVKRFISKWVFPQATDFPAGTSFIKSEPNQLKYWYFSMGGKYLPYDFPMDNTMIMYQQLLSFFHLNFNMGFLTNQTIQYCTNTDSSTGHALHNFLKNFFWFCCVFDRLPQNNQVMSGISTERFDIQLHVDLAIQLLTPLLVSFFEYDIIVHFRGGLIEIED